MSGCERVSEEGGAGVAGRGAVSRSAGPRTCEEPGFEASKRNDKKDLSHSSLCFLTMCVLGVRVRVRVRYVHVHVHVLRVIIMCMSLFVQLVCGIIAGTVASFAVSPFEVVHTRVVAEHGGRSVWEVLQRVAKFEGIESLLKGNLKVSLFATSLQKGVQVKKAKEKGL